MAKTLTTAAKSIDRRTLVKGAAGAIAAGSAMSAALAQASTGNAGFFVNRNQDGGELVIYAPHLKVISNTHGALIEKYGYAPLERVCEMVEGSDESTDVVPQPSDLGRSAARRPTDGHQ